MQVDENTSDGYHTFKELYEHRIALFVALCKEIKGKPYGYPIEVHRTPVWRSKLHFDGSNYPDWFVMGIHTEKGKQITYHLPLRLWDETDFATTYEKAPEWDGHTPDDVIKRIKKL